jgi:hypothetical protein
MPPEAFTTRDRCSGIDVLVSRRRDRGEQPVVEALVVALQMVVLDELRDRDTKVAFTERDELVEAFRLDGEHEAFREGVQVGASSWELEAVSERRRLGAQRPDRAGCVMVAARDAIG